MAAKDATPLLIVAGFVILILLIIARRKDDEIEALKAKIDSDKQLSEDLRRRLFSLIEGNEDLDPAVVQEIMSIAALVEIKQETKALFSLAKVIERLLKELYSDDPDFMAREEHTSFASYLEHAKKKGIVSKDDFHFISALWHIRNEEAHELNVQKEKSRIHAAFVTGTSFIIVLSRLVRKKILAGTLSPNRSLI